MATPIYPSEVPPGGDGQASQERPSITIEEELGQWPEHVDARVTEALLAAQQERSEQEQIRNDRRQPRVRAVVLASAVLLLSTIALVWWFNREKFTLRSASLPTPPTPVSSLQDTSLKVERSKEPVQSVKETEATLSQHGQDILHVVQLEFFADKFIVDNTELRNQAGLIDNLQSRRALLDGGWVLIFTTASLEGQEDYNLCLCSQRAVAISGLVQNEAGINAKSYWGILAGEKKVDLLGVKPGGEEEAEEVLAREKGKEWLNDQRRLIVVGIKELVPLQPQAAAQVPFVVAKHLYDNNLFPQDYDSPGSRPFLITQKASVEDCGRSKKK